jgi:hypothetical protein
LKAPGPQADVLYNKFPGIPAVIVSAGPSLERHFDLLNEIGNRALIIAPGTGAGILDRRGIRAHLVMAVDGSENEADIFKGYRGTCPLVGSFRLHPRIGEEFPNPILRLATSSDRLSHYYYRRFLNESLAMIDDHPSVSCCAIDYAVKLGCNPIILIGQDLCYYDNKLHADDNPGGPQASMGKTREMRDINGLPVVTNNSFLAMRYELEIQNQEYGDRVQIINATEAGLGIPGVANWPFRDVIRRFIDPQRCDVAETIAAVLSRYCSGHARAACKRGEHDMAAFYDHLLDQIDLIERKNREKAVLLGKLDRMRKRGLKSNRLNDRMAAIDDINTKLGGNNFYQEVVIANLNSVIQYYLLAVQSKFGAKEQSPDTFIKFETFLVGITAKYLANMKSMMVKSQSSCKNI